MLKLTSNRFIGPLKDLMPLPFYIEDFNEFEKISIGFIGDTYAGKTQYIKNLINTLGGVFQEERNYNKRTLNDSSYVFGEIEKNGVKKTIALQLKSHAGHNIGYGDNGPKTNHSVLVFKYLKSSTFDKQLRLVRPILEKEDINLVESYGLITRINSASELTTRRRNTIMKKNLKGIFYINNPKRNEYYLRDFDDRNVDLLLSVLENNYPSIKLLYFGNEKIPHGLEGKLIKFENHLSIKNIPKEGFKYDEDKLMNQVWEEMSREEIAF